MWGSTDNEVYSKYTQNVTCERKDIFPDILTSGISGVPKSSIVLHELFLRVVINKYMCGRTKKFVSSPPCACSGSTGQKP